MPLLLRICNRRKLFLKEKKKRGKKKLPVVVIAGERQAQSSACSGERCRSAALNPSSSPLARQDERSRRVHRRTRKWSKTYEKLPGEEANTRVPEVAQRSSGTRLRSNLANAQLRSLFLFEFFMLC